MPKLPFRICHIQLRLVTNPESQPGLTGCPILHLRVPVPSVQQMLPIAGPQELKYPDKL